MEQAIKQAKETTGNPFFGMTTIPVKLTYRFTDPATVITFFCKMALSDDDKKARQAFYAQSDGDQAAGQHAYYVELLARVTTVKRPDGLPGFDEFWSSFKQTRTDDTALMADVKDAVRQYLGTDVGEMKIKVVADAIEEYTRITQPAEFFR